MIDEVPTVKLNTGAEIPVIGFGTWGLQARQGSSAVLEAFKAGYRLIDTAMIYDNEKEVGEAIRASGLHRKDIFVTTKLWNSYQGYKTALAAFEESLERLGLEYIDLYLIHWPATDKRDESWEALTELYKHGRAKAIGVSNYTIRHLAELAEKSSIIPAVNQIEFHPFLYKDQLEVLEFCKKHKIIVQAYSPLAQAHRINDPLLATIAEGFGKTPSQVMLRWALQHGTIPIPKAAHREHTISNIDVFDFQLTADDMAAIDNLSDGTRTSSDPSKLP